jgi:hypothetical protein
MAFVDFRSRRLLLLSFAPPRSRVRTLTLHTLTAALMPLRWRFRDLWMLTHIRSKPTITMAPTKPCKFIPPLSHWRASSIHCRCLLIARCDPAWLVEISQWMCADLCAAAHSNNTSNTVSGQNGVSASQWTHGLFSRAVC